MTSLNDAKEAVYARFLAQYTGVTADRITFDNENFETPVTGSWVRLTVRNISRAQSTLGKKTNRRFRAQAIVFVQVYTEADTGVKLSGELAEEAQGIFEGESFSGLDFQSVTINETGPDGKWYQSIAEAPFSYDQIK